MMGQTVANGVFHISHNQSLLIYETMKNAQKTYEANNWASLGAIPLTQALRHICKIQHSEFAANFVTGGKTFLSPLLKTKFTKVLDRKSRKIQTLEKIGSGQFYIKFTI